MHTVRGDGCIQPRFAGVALALMSVWTFGGTPVARAAPSLDHEVPVEITADRIDYSAKEQVYTASGSVRVLQGERQIDAEWLAFNRLTRRGVAAGNVRVDDGTSLLQARFVQFDESGQQGLMVAGRLDMGENDFRMAAGEILKTGDDTYEVEDASFSTCRCKDDDDRLPWQINANEADVELGGYATATNVTTDILGIPALWFPWVMFPVKTERASGVLLPEFAVGSSNGFEIGLPIFWAARHNINVIATPRYLTARGFKPELEVQTVYGEHSETNLSASYIRDKDALTYFDGTSASHERERTISSKNRWGVGLDTDTHLPGGVRVRSDIKVVSDNGYVRDFNDFRGLHRDRFLESRLFAFGHFGPGDSGAATAGAVHVDDRQNVDFNDRDAFVLQRMPEATLAWLPSPIPGAAGLTLGMDADYVYFNPYERVENKLELSQGIDIDPDPLVTTIVPVLTDERFADIGIAADKRFTAARGFGGLDGVFQEGEPINDRGHRVVLHPNVSHSFRLFDAIDILPEAGWHQTLYSTHTDSFAERGLVTARLDIATQLLGELDLPLLPAVMHRVEPRVGGAFISDVGQNRNPFFVPRTRVPQSRIRQLSLDNMLRDPSDRIDEAQIVVAGIGNRFFVPGGAGPQLRAELDLSAAYDFTGSGTGDFGLLIADGALLPSSGISADFNVAYSIEENEISQGQLDLSVPTPDWMPLKEGSYFTAGYRYRRDVPLFFENFSLGKQFDGFSETFTRIHQITGFTRLRLTESWAVEYRVGYSFEQTLLLRNQGALEYTSGCKCWAIKFSGSQDRTRGFQATLAFTVLGFGQDLANPFRQGLSVRQDLVE